MRARRITFIAFLCLALGTLGLGVAPAAHADVTYNPPAGTFNGNTIYLSQACHDGNDGVPGGPCIPNSGCQGYNENAQSQDTAIAAATSVAGEGLNLIERGYRVVRGNGTASQNINNSNAVGARLHIPLHTNAVANYNCTTALSGYGTQVLYYSTNGRNCSNLLVARVGAVSPGTNDVALYRDNLGELRNTNAVACYLEAEFHTWNTGVNWIRTEESWAWRIASAVDEYLGYP